MIEQSIRQTLEVLGLIVIVICLLLIISGSIYTIREHLRLRRIAQDARDAARQARIDMVRKS